jgi:DNA polymerase III subunit delta
MQLRQSDLAGHLARTLLPVYLISGDEPLQVLEAADAVRHAARERGHGTREVLEVGKTFDWGQLAAEAGSLSLFGDRRLLELRLASSRPGTEGSRAIADYCARPPDDAALLVLTPRLERDQSRSAWFKAVDAVGAVLQIWPVDAARLPGWVAQRMRQRGLSPGPGVAEMLAERSEGNLLACVQEIEKLFLLQGGGTVTVEQLAAAVADSARFDIYGLVDTTLGGSAARSLRMLRGLRAEGTAESLVLWAFARETRMLAEISAALDAGGRADALLQAHRVWDKRKPLVQQALRRGSTALWRQALVLCERCDRAIKGMGSGDPWRLLEEVTLALAGRPLPPRALS